MGLHKSFEYEFLRIQFDCIAHLCVLIERFSKKQKQKNTFRSLDDQGALSTTIRTVFAYLQVSNT